MLQFLLLSVISFLSPQAQCAPPDPVAQYVTDQPAQLAISGAVACGYVGVAPLGPDSAEAVTNAFEALVGGKAVAVGEERDTLTADWTDGLGVHQVVKTVRGQNESRSDFVKRHIETVKEMEAAFPPQQHTGCIRAINAPWRSTSLAA